MSEEERMSHDANRKQLTGTHLNEAPLLKLLWVKRMIDMRLAMFYDLTKLCCKNTFLTNFVCL